MVVTATDLRNRRVLARIPGRVLCDRAGLNRGRLSEIERGHVKPRAAELERLETALENLIRAKREVSAFAATCGWPTGAL